MGIKGLFPYIRDNAPGAIVETSLKDYMGRRLAVDASMHLYSFLAAIRTGGDATHLTNSRGEATSHLQGFANRTLRMLEAGAKPVFHNDDVKRLLRLMGVPVVEAPGEAEASCVALVRHGACDFVVTEDMDALTFGAAKMVKNLFDVEGAPRRSASARSTSRRRSASSGPGAWGPWRPRRASRAAAPLATSSTADDGADGDEAAPAPKAAKRVGRKVGGPVAPRGWDFRAARALFFAPTVVAAGETVDAPPPDYAALRAFLVDGHEFNGDRVDKMVARLRKCREAKPQKRIDDFFSKSPAKGPAQSPARSPAAKPEPAAKREPDGAAKREPDGGDDIGLDAPSSAASSGTSASASKKRKSPAKRPKPAASAEVARAFFAGETRDATPSKKKKKAG
ncbi:endonuclease [Aureococcus anophagefferens]|nr:endonuclease [Aureococcus anophagefferens]